MTTSSPHFSVRSGMSSDEHPRGQGLALSLPQHINLMYNFPLFHLYLVSHKNFDEYLCSNYLTSTIVHMGLDRITFSTLYFTWLQGIFYSNWHALFA